jgi:hypothetical protein
MRPLLRWLMTGIGGLLAALPSGEPRAQAVDIGIVVREARGDDPLQNGYQLQPGVTRDDEPVTLGLPLPDGSGITSANQLGLSGAALGQFRALATWPSGNLQWVLVDTQIDVAANGSVALRLVPGNGNFGGAALASDLGSAIVVDTGAAQFRMRKSGFNLLERVTVGALDVVPGLPGDPSPGIELIGTDGTAYRSLNDATSEVAIEENGPVRAVVRARGTLRSSGGARNLEYTVRMHFQRGKARVRVFHTLRNGSLLQVANQPYQSLELVLRSALAAPTFAVSTHTGENIGSLGAADTLRLFVGEVGYGADEDQPPDGEIDGYPTFTDYDFTDFDGQGNLITTRWPTTIRGYTLRRNATTLVAGTRTQYFDLVYARAATADGAVVFGTRFASGWWPQGLGIDGDGTLRVGLFPAGNDKPYYARFAGHVTREVLFDFTPGAAASARDRYYAFQYPLVAKADDVDVYNRSRALWEPLLSLDDEVASYQARGWPVQQLLDRRPDFRIYRHYYWGTGGGNNQYDFTKIDLHSFLRRGADFAGGYWLAAEQRIAYNADLSIYHSDDFDAAAFDAQGNSIAPDFDELQNTEFVPVAKPVFEGEHRHAYGIPLQYYLGGDERLRDAYLDWGDWMRHFQAEGFNDYERGIAWNLYNLIDLYRFSGDARYRDLARQFLADEVLPPAVAGVSPGTDVQRGFFVSRYVTNNPVPGLGRVVNSFIYGAMIPRAYAYLLDYGNLPALERDRVRDLLDAACRFLSHEHWYEYPDGGGNLTVTNFGLPYAQSLDVPRNPPDARLEPNWFGGFKEAWNTFTFGYQVTGDAEFLRRGELLQWTTAANPENFNWPLDWPDRQRLQGLLDAPNAGPVWRELPLAVSDLGGGSYRLSWTVPPNASQYWIKSADRAIVPWLDFDRVTRQFAFDPAQFVPFFAATNLDGEPAPAPAGSLQTWTISGQGANRRFAARYLGDAALDSILADGFESP